MNYDEVKVAFFDPTSADNAVPSIVGVGSPARRLRDAFEPLAMHAVWSPLVHRRMAERGLDFFGTYVWGRACVLGEPSGAVVASVFAAFEPGMIAGIYDEARATVSLEDARRITFESTAESLASTLGTDDLDAVGSVGARLAEVVDALDRTGRPLFAGVASLGWPDDSHGRLFQACLALREHRGDAHVAAYIGAGFGPVEMNILTELWLGYPLGAYSGSRAWPEATTEAALAGLRDRDLLDGDDLTSLGRSVRGTIEDSTDAMEQPVVDALGGELDTIVGQLAIWSRRCVDAAMFPPDPRKRAAG